MSQALRWTAIGTLAGVALMGSSSAAPAAAPERSVPRTVPAELAASFELLRQPPVKAVPRSISRFVAGPMGERFRLNPKLARKFVPPGGRMVWHVVPGSRGVCLLAKAAASCAPTRQALEGAIFLQSIPAYTGPGAETSPLPGAHGQPERSTTVGLVPDGVVAVRAATKSGSVVEGQLGPDGAYRLVATDVTSLLFERSTLTVRLRPGQAAKR